MWQVKDSVLFKGQATENLIMLKVSPLRILRNADFQSNIAGIYPCGEGAGYAGGITSAAMDGIKTAEKLAGHYQLPT